MGAVMTAAAKVSILAHPERWALPLAKFPRNTVNKFQSSPTPKGGRYYKPRHRRSRPTLFQSSPTPKGGRYYSASLSFAVQNPVSILAHPERWALPHTG